MVEAVVAPSVFPLAAHKRRHHADCQRSLQPAMTEGAQLLLSKVTALLLSKSASYGVKTFW